MLRSKTISTYESVAWFGNTPSLCLQIFKYIDEQRNNYVTLHKFVLSKKQSKYTVMLKYPY